MAQRERILNDVLEYVQTIIDQQRRDRANMIRLLRTKFTEDEIREAKEKLFATAETTMPQTDNDVHDMVNVFLKTDPMAIPTYIDWTCSKFQVIKPSDYYEDLKKVRNASIVSRDNVLLATANFQEIIRKRAREEAKEEAKARAGKIKKRKRSM